jgi:hypothetical protein
MLIGQLFLVTAVARVVSMFPQRQPSVPGDDDQAGGM